MWLKVLGVAVAAWIVLSVLGAIFKFLGTALVIGALVFVGVTAYGAIRNRSRRELGS
jgi:hypothetical protein